MFKPRAPVFSPTYKDHVEHTAVPNFVELVEKSAVFSRIEKLELLALYLGFKMTTEVYMNIPFSLVENTETADTDFVFQLEAEVQKLGLPYFIDSHTKVHRATSNIRKFVWFQICRNSTIRDYLEKNQNSLSDMDYGALYGFPVSAIQAFCGFLPAATTAPATVGCYYFGGIFSQPFMAEEQKYFDRVWQKITELSPYLSEQAELHYQKETQST